jgi:predicted nucleic acid-binding protein
VKRLIFDTGPFLLLFTKEKGSMEAREAVLKYEEDKIEIFMHPNNLAEAYKVISQIRKENPSLLLKDLEPEEIIRSAYATLKVIQDEAATVKLGMLKFKYSDKPWGDLSSAALSLSLSEEEKVPVVILDHEKHFDDIKEISTIRISNIHQILDSL